MVEDYRVSESTSIETEEKRFRCIYLELQEKRNYAPKNWKKFLTSCTRNAILKRNVETGNVGTRESAIRKVDFRDETIEKRMTSTGGRSSSQSQTPR